jgi:hypothetical protein
MHLISKLAALVLFAAGAATLASATPSAAQGERQAVPNAAAEVIGPAAECCRPATKTFATGQAGWTLTLPSGQTQTPVAVVPKHPIWANPLPGSQWIGPHANSASASEPGGKYVYEYHFCLCPLPKGVQSVPATLNMNIWADDDFTASVDGQVVAQHLGGWGFTTSPPAPPGKGAPAGGTTAVSTRLHECDNVIRIEVINAPGSPTGLDVLGSISGYFQDVPPGKPCPCRHF